MKTAPWAATFACLAPTAAIADELPPLLEQAIAAAEASLPPAESRFAFTQTIDGSEGVRIVARFDPTVEDNGGWTLLEPADDELDGDARRAFEQMIESEEAPDRELFLEEPREAAISCEGPVSAADDVALFACLPPDDDDDIAAFRDALRAEISVDLDGPMINGFRIYAVDEFKPAPIAKVREMDMRIEFAPAWQGGPPVVTQVTQTVSGSAMFRRFDQRVVVTYSDVTAVE